MRNGVESASHWRDRSVLGDRVTFHVNISSSGSVINSRLVFNTTLAQDAGPYRCRVDFWKAATRNYKIYLQLIEEAQTVQIYDGTTVTSRAMSSLSSLSWPSWMFLIGEHPIHDSKLAPLTHTLRL